MKKGFFQEHAEALVGLHRAYDLFAIVAGALVSFHLRYDHLEFHSRFQVVLLLSLLLALIVFSALGVYRPWRGQPIWSELQTLAAAWLFVLMALLGLAYFSKTGAEFSRVWLSSWFALTFGLLAAQRVALRAFLRHLRRLGRNRRRALIVGAGRHGRDVATHLRQAQWTGIEVVAFLDDNREIHGRRIGDVPVLGGIDELVALCGGEPTTGSDCIGNVEQVWIALPFSAQGRVEDVLAILDKTGVQVHFTPDLFGFRMLNHSVEEFAGIPVVNLSASPLVGANAVLKDISDRLFASLALLLLSPLMLLIAIGVKASSPGPVLYRQERVSWNGRRFDMLKFRSMPVGVESASGPVWAKPDEHRATRFGALLRKTSLDELPQFINVLKGEMSIVGPRPERPHFIDELKDKIPGYMKKHLVKAGITGWAQVNGWRGNTSIEKRIEHDLYYIQNWSLWLDARIIIRTIFGGMFGKHAY